MSGQEMDMVSSSLEVKKRSGQRDNMGAITLNKHGKDLHKDYYNKFFFSLLLLMRLHDTLINFEKFH